MKKIMIILAVAALSCHTANAQLGRLVRKAAEKAVEKTTDKIVDKTAEAASDAVVNATTGKSTKTDAKTTNAKSESTTAAPVRDTYRSLMQELPALPTVQQMVNHKDYELNERSLKLLASAVTKYNATVLRLTTRVMSLSYENADSAQVAEAAYRATELYTGLSREEIDHLSTLSEEEQEAYLAKHYQEGTAEAAMMKQAVDVSKYLEPVQPLIDKWNAVDSKIADIYTAAEPEMKKAYSNYADKLASATGADRTKLLLKYFADIAPLQRQCIEKAMKLRLDEQLPIAEEIEKEMVQIRAKHQDAATYLLNYPQLTASQYLAETARLCELKEYK